MQFLLDTHVVIWLANGDSKLPIHIRQILDNKSNDIYVSMISFWEMSIKSRKGKLDLHKPLDEIVQSLLGSDYSILPMYLSHIYCLGTLPSHHEDPFDRMLIAQSIDGGFVLVSCDEMFDCYDVRRLW
jgi:PIN domain nuclease of toxin-antitoxin system